MYTQRFVLKAAQFSPFVPVARLALSWLRLSFLEIYCGVGRYRTRVKTRKRHLNFLAIYCGVGCYRTRVKTRKCHQAHSKQESLWLTTSACLKYSWDGKACVLIANTSLKHSEMGKFACSPPTNA